MKRDTIYVFQVVVGVLFIAAGGAKLAGAEIMVRQFEVIGLGQWLRPVVGSLEILGGIALLVPRAAAYGAALVGLTILGSTGAAIGHIASAGQPHDRPQATSATYYHTRTDHVPTLEAGPEFKPPAPRRGFDI